MSFKPLRDDERIQRIEKRLRIFGTYGALNTEALKVIFEEGFTGIEVALEPELPDNELRSNPLNKEEASTLSNLRKTEPDPNICRLHLNEDLDISYINLGRRYKSTKDSKWNRLISTLGG